MKNNEYKLVILVEFKSLERFANTSTPGVKQRIKEKNKKIISYYSWFMDMQPWLKTVSIKHI